MIVQVLALLATTRPLSDGKRLSHAAQYIVMVSSSSRSSRSSCSSRSARNSRNLHSMPARTRTRRYRAVGTGVRRPRPTLRGCIRVRGSLSGGRLGEVARA